MRTTLVTLATVVATGLGLASVGPAGPAAGMSGPSGPSGSHQSRPTHHRIADPVRDVYVLLENPDGSDAGWAARPHVRNGDITSAVVRHRASAVTTTIRLAQLRRPGSIVFAVVSLRTAQDTWNTTLYTHASNPRPEIFFDNNRGGEVSCPRASARIDYAADVIRVRVPRHCMDDPAWVRPSVATVTVPKAGSLLVDVAPGNRPRDEQQFGARIWHAGR